MNRSLCYGLTWSQLRNEPRRHPVRRLNDGWTYYPADSHVSSVEFRKRMRDYAKRAKA